MGYVFVNRVFYCYNVWIKLFESNRKLTAALVISRASDRVTFQYSAVHVQTSTITYRHDYIFICLSSAYFCFLLFVFRKSNLSQFFRDPSETFFIQLILSKKSLPLLVRRIIRSTVPSSWVPFGFLWYISAPKQWFVYRKRSLPWWVSVCHKALIIYFVRKNPVLVVAKYSGLQANPKHTVFTVWVLVSALFVCVRVYCVLAFLLLNQPWL